MKMTNRNYGNLLPHFLFFISVFSLPDARAQNGNSVDYATAHLSRIVDAVRIDEPIALDGRLDEAAWNRARPAADFIQWEPIPGAPATEKTEVRFLYDGENLYVGIKCFDSDPSRIIVNEIREDFAGQEGDGFSLFIDTIHDRRSGFFFGTNPGGAKRDSQISNDGEQNNMDWDGVWEVKADINAEGWFAEMEIPFKTLRFRNPPSPEWSLNMTRRVRRLNEDSHWSPLPRRYRVFKASLAGTVRGFEGISQGRNLKIKPYASATASKVPPGGQANNDLNFDGGVDLKYGLTPALTLDLTYRTDFSQVEVDQQQVNLTRFNLFFPEKREFFLENASTFNFGQRSGGGGGGGGGGGNTNLLPFFSRRIGLSAEGTPIPIIGGARVSGKAGTYDVGMLVMKTESHGANPSNNYWAGRIKKNLLRNSWVGFLATNRDSTVAGDYNRTFGADAIFQFFQKLDVASYYLKSHTPNRSGRNAAGSMEIAWRDNDYSFSGQYEQVQENFNPEMGFVRRRNNTHYASDFSWRPRPKAHPYIRNYNFTGSADYYAGGTGKVETREQTLNFGVMMHSSAAANVKVTNTWDRLTKNFAVRSDLSIPAGDYRYPLYEASFNLNRSRKVSGSGTLQWGSFWNGDRKSVSGTLDLKPSYHLNIDMTYSLNDVKLPTGVFRTQLVGVRSLYAFTSKMFLNAFLQYNTDTRQFSSNIRFNIIHHPLSDFYVVFNERRDTINGALLERTLVLKLTNLFNF